MRSSSARVAGLAAALGAMLVFARAAGAEGPAAPSTPSSGAVVFEAPDARGLSLFLRDKDGRNYGSLEAVNAAVKASGRKMVFAMNAGMYEPDRSPTGLFVQDGRPVTALNVQTRVQGAGTPNFYLSPNGVFAIGSSGPVILSTEDYARSPPDRTRLATQSGPVLLAKRMIVSPAVARGTDAQDHRNRRNGICVNGKKVVLVEVDAMTLHEFAIYLRDVVKCVDALYMDGVVSSVYDARSGRSDSVSAQDPLGPILAYVE